MGYHVTILRTQGAKSIPIKKEEVMELVSAMPDLSAEEDSFGRLEIRNHALQGETLLIWQDGEIWSSDPSKDVLHFMLSLSRMLNARVRGDEFETYSSVEEAYIHPDDKEELSEAKNFARNLVRKTRYRQWFLNAGIIAFFVVLIFFVKYFSG